MIFTKYNTYYPSIKYQNVLPKYSYSTQESLTNGTCRNLVIDLDLYGKCIRRKEKIKNITQKDILIYAIDKSDFLMDKKFY